MITDTVAAVSTPRGKGGVAVLRVSGNAAVEIAARVFEPKNGRALCEIPSRVATYGTVFVTEADGTDTCDFSGKEIASVLEEVNHPNVGGLYDVGNAASVLLDPNDDIDYLAPWAVAMHFKDMKVIDNPVFEHLWQDMPVIYKGCLLGEGVIDFDRVMTAVCEKAPRQKDMPILSEPAFILPENHYNCLEEMHQFDRECTYQFVDFMQKLVDRY